MKKIPRKFIFIFILLAIIIIAIPIYYLTMYYNTKIDIPTSFGVTENVRELKYNQVNDYDLQIVCTEFDITDDYQASYEITISEERINGTLLNNNFTVKLSLSSNWISSDAFKSSSSRTISMNSSSSHKQSTTISNLEIFANRTNYLLPFPKPCLYVLVTYTVTDRGNSYEHNDIISYEYGTYEIKTGGYRN